MQFKKFEHALNAFKPRINMFIDLNPKFKMEKCWIFLSAILAVVLSGRAANTNIMRGRVEVNEPRHEKTCLPESRPGPVLTRGLKFRNKEEEGLYYIFGICKKQVFSRHSWYCLLNGCATLFSSYYSHPSKFCVLFKGSISVVFLMHR